MGGRPDRVAGRIGPARCCTPSRPPYKGGVQQANRSVLGLVFLTVFIDLVGFSILFPLFPQLLDYYVGREGEGSLIGRLAAALAEFVGERGNTRVGVVALFGGILGSLYSLLQFLFTPFWGALSDRIGRRPTLLVTLAGTALSYLLWLFADAFALLVLARLLGGVMAGNISIASAVVADTHAGPQRAKGMGIVGMAIGLGFVLGPAIGGLSAQWTPAPGGGGPIGLHPFSGAALAAFVLALFNFVWALTHFPETRPRGAVGEGPHRTLRPLHELRRLTFPGVRRANLTSLGYLTIFSGMEFTLVFLAVERFDFGYQQNAWMFVFVGLVIALVQGGAIRRLAPRYGERRLAQVGLALLVPGFLAVGLTASVPQLYAGLFLMAVGSALAMPSLSSLVSRYAPSDVQGLVLGTFRSMGALARALGPVLGGLVYWLAGSAAPYVAGAVLLLVPLALALKLPPVPAEGDPRAAPAP